MGSELSIKSALISVFHKDAKIETIIKQLSNLGVKLYSTGGTFDFIKKLGIEAVAVEDITSYPSILGGRVKTLHPKIFGGILARRKNAEDIKHLKEYDIPEIDLVIVDLYPFEQTVASSDNEEDIIEKIDIGGISLIRAAAKNFKDVIIIPSSEYYDKLINLLEIKKGITNQDDRRYFAMQAFAVSSHYDTAIFKYFENGSKMSEIRNQNSDTNNLTSYVSPLTSITELRYGENPHQKGIFYGNLDLCFDKLNGKEISYNNLIDIDAAVNVINEFKEPAFAVIKHTNICGAACRDNLTEAWKAALAGDPVSAFGGIIVTNREINNETAEEINKLFFEVIIAPAYGDSALYLLKTKKNRIILQSKKNDIIKHQFKSVLNGVIEQERDLKVETFADLKPVTKTAPTESEMTDIIFGNIIVKHNKSNAIVFAKNKQLIGIGTGQTSRVDATEQAISKAKKFAFDMHGAIMASDAFFPFPDCAELAYNAGITAIVQPGGSVRDNESIEFCNKYGVAMVFTGFRHFKH